MSCSRKLRMKWRATGARKSSLPTGMAETITCSPFSLSGDVVAPPIAAASRRRPDDEDIPATTMPANSIGDELLTGPGDGDGPRGLHVARAGAGSRSGSAWRAEQGPMFAPL